VFSGKPPGVLLFAGRSSLDEGAAPAQKSRKDGMVAQSCEPLGTIARRTAKRFAKGGLQLQIERPSR
jgi:hypothetical protein